MDGRLDMIYIATSQVVVFLLYPAMMAGNNYIDCHCWLIHDLDLVSLIFIAMIDPYFIF